MIKQKGNHLAADMCQLSAETTLYLRALAETGIYLSLYADAGFLIVALQTQTARCPIEQQFGPSIGEHDQRKENHCDCSSESTDCRINRRVVPRSGAHQDRTIHMYADAESRPG
jgi:hypothetical protein